MKISSNFFDVGLDYNYTAEGGSSGKMELYCVSKIRQSYLTTAAQGFWHRAVGRRSTTVETNNESNSANTSSVKDVFLRQE